MKSSELIGSHQLDVDELFDRFESEPSHVLHVARLADQVYLGLQDWHRLKPADRIVLQLGALLHDLGWAVTQPDGKGHHKESAKLIRTHPWRHLPAEEREVVAQVARYHRKSLPSVQDHPEFAALAPHHRRRVEILASFLRIADGLDRKHLGKVMGVVVHRDLLSTRIHAFGEEIREEIQAAQTKSDLLCRCFPGEVTIVAAPGWGT